MPKELAKNFDPAAYEERLYEAWEKSGAFNPDCLNLPPEAPTYTIVLPPPNITDKLHLGHSAMLAIEDLFIRFHRMRGFRTLWIPGTDHAAIATQTVVEKKLQREEGLSRHDLGRVRFLQHVWQFLTETQSVILNQIRKMGASLDWSRLAFTLDDQRQAAVREMFVRMYEDGLIYRGERIVNWCPRCQSTLADDEVEHEPRVARLYTFRYDADFPIPISTTRPETKLGDTGVAVNPKDKRYAKYIGQTLTANFCGQTLKLKIIGDHNVDMAFGTGAVGVTPAHSMVDWQMAEANQLPVIKVINEEAKILPGFGDYSGLSAEAAREQVVAWLRAETLMIKEEDLENNLSVCYRCGSAIEPLPSKQWFVAVDKPLERLGGKSLKRLAWEAADSGQIQFLPERFKKKYLDWMANLKDWCISRQIWFGHEIPVWYRGDEVYVGRSAPQDEGWVQDADTLDTWFSSGMWTFSTLGWPSNYGQGKAGDLLKFHPTQMLETGYEIITLWVSRMVMMSYFALGEIPFEKVYLHGMVLDKHGKKMSKTKGNGIDPLSMIELYGTDAVRWSLLVGTSAGNDMRFYEDKIQSSRNFVNKLWNIARFILSQLPDQVLTVERDRLGLADQWILSRLERVKEEVTRLIEAHEFSAAGELLQSFAWDELADWYLEAVKFSASPSSAAVMRRVLKELVIMLHPYMPFVTEAIWEALGKEQLLIVRRWPAQDTSFINPEAERRFQVLRELVGAIRNARNENKIEPAKKLPALIVSDQLELMRELETLICSLRTGIAGLVIAKEAADVADAIYIKTLEADVYLLGAIDKDQERTRLAKELTDTEALIGRLHKQLANQEFVSNAPELVVDKERQRLADAEERLKSLREALAKL